MRSQKDVEKSLRFNEEKARLLLFLVKAKKYYHPRDISRILKITQGNARFQLHKLYRQRYIYRKKSRTGTGYVFRYTKPLGRKMAEILWCRMKLRETDSRILLNLKKQKVIPYELKKQYEQLQAEYYRWLVE